MTDRNDFDVASELATTGDLAASATANEDVPHLLDPGSVRVVARPRALLLVWIWQLVAGVALATPIQAWAGRVWGAHPDGDAVLFRPGAHALLTWVGDKGPALSVVFRTTAIAFFVFVVLGQLVTGAVVASLATGVGENNRAPTRSFAFGVAARAFWPLVGIIVAFASVQALVLGAGWLAASSLADALTSSLGDARAFTAGAVCFGVFAVVVLVVGVVCDLARTAVIIDAVGRTTTMRAALKNAFTVALTTSRASLGRACLAWTARAVPSVALVVAGGWAGDVVGGRAGVALWLLVAVHQIIVLLRTALRVSWLAQTVRFVRGA